MRIYSLDYKQYHFPPGLMDSCFGALWTQFEAACFTLLGMLFEGWTKSGPQHAEDSVGHEQTASSCLC